MAVSETTTPTVRVGLLADPGLPAELSEDLAGELPDLLDRETAGRARWQVETATRSIVPGRARCVPAVQPESGATMAATAELGSYINDHLGGANAGLAMAQRLEQDLRGEHMAEALGNLSGEIRDDLRALRAIARQMDVTENPIKQAVGWAGEKLHRLGLTALAPGSSRLRRLRAVESLSLGVEGKLALWTALIAVAPDYPQLDPVDLQRLADRARDQRRRVEEVRLMVARGAFGIGG